jgi:glycosyltransferase involved in cell wall biosynthesis
VPDAVIYSRDAVTLALIAALLPRRAPRAFYEAHTFPATCFGLRLRRWMARRVGGVVTITGHLAQRYRAQRYRALGVPAEGVLVAHDGFRAARFAIEGDRAYWRGHYGWPQDAFIVGYAGRFLGGQTGIEKGIGTLVEAFEALSADESLRRVYLALVGGPESCLDPLRARLGERLLAPGMVPPDAVPGYLRAFDVCAMAPPWNDFFAYYTSPLKLFEYMASGTPLVASDLPSTAEVIRDGVNGLLVPPSDAAALADALRRLRDDPALGQRLAAQAARDVRAYAWDARARRILDFVAGAG